MSTIGIIIVCDPDLPTQTFSSDLTTSSSDIPNLSRRPCADVRGQYKNEKFNI